MKKKDIIKDIENVFSNDVFCIDNAIDLVNKYHKIDSESYLNLIEDQIVKECLSRMELYKGSAKEKFLNEEIDNIEKEIEKFGRANKYLMALKQNVIARLELEIVKISNGTDLVQRPRIGINCEITLFLAFVKAMQEEFSNSVITDYRISQLVSDNFSDENSRAIKLKYCTNKFSTGNGIALSGNEKLKSVLEKMLKKIS